MNPAVQSCTLQYTAYALPLLLREEQLASAGVDLDSCLPFLFELYAQWMRSSPTAAAAAETPPLVLLTATVRSTLVLSDVFTETGHFRLTVDSYMGPYLNDVRIIDGRGLDQKQITVLYRLCECDSDEAEGGKNFISLTDFIKERLPRQSSCFNKIHLRWMGECFLEVLRVHPAEDESLNSLLTLGICKALAITGCADPWQA